MKVFYEKMRDWAQTDRVALIVGEEQLTFRQLWTYSDALAAYLTAFPRKAPVVIWGDKENENMVCFYGALKGGHPFVFIPSHYPQSRAMDIVEDCEPCLVFAISDLPFPVEKENLPVVTRPQLYDILASHADCCVTNDNYLTYADIWEILYTSGSTGKPKGVIITGGNILSKLKLCLEGFWDSYYPEDEQTRNLNMGSYAFSISLGTIYFELAVAGACIHSVPHEMLTNYPALFEYLLQTNPHIMTATPSFYELCLRDERFNRKNLSAVNYMCLGGEPFHASLYRRIAERFPGTDIYNGYGATEMAAQPHMALITPDILELDPEGVLPIGDLKICDGTVTIVDENDREVPEGEIGEMLIAGGYVSPGYLHQPEMTEQAFFVNENGVRGFRTKDLVCKRGDYIFYKGRKDNLVKCGGNRIELEDVESNLRKIDTVRMCCVVPVYNGDTVSMLAAYVVLHTHTDKKIAAALHIRSEAAKLVQAYMIPQRIVIVDELPRNVNGKLDRKALIEMCRVK